MKNGSRARSQNGLFSKSKWPFEEMRAWLQILQIVENSTLFYKLFDSPETFYNMEFILLLDLELWKKFELNLLVLLDSECMLNVDLPKTFFCMKKSYSIKLPFDVEIVKKILNGTYLFYILLHLLQIHKIECGLQYKISPLTPPNIDTSEKDLILNVRCIKNRAKHKLSL